MENITKILKDTIAKLPRTYFLRASDYDANISLDDIDMNKITIFIYHNLPEVTNTIQEGGLVQESWPIEIDIFRLAEIDDNTKDGDYIRNICKELADMLMDKLKIRNDSVEPIDEYTIYFSDSVKLHDKVVTGLRLSFSWKIDRKKYSC